MRRFFTTTDLKAIVRVAEAEGVIGTGRKPSMLFSAKVLAAIDELRTTSGQALPSCLRPMSGESDPKQLDV